MMPLPTGGEWPPRDWKPILDVQAEWAAWYSGDPNRIAEVHSGLVYTPTRKGRFWAQDVREERRVMLHVPLASDLAAVSADMLFSEPPKFVIPEAASGNNTAAKKTQDVLERLAEQNELHNRLLEAAEQAAGVGGVYLRVVMDPELANYPILSPVPGDSALPEFRWGRLVAVTFWRTVYDDGKTVLRHLERHELREGRGVILHGLYMGTIDMLGRKIPLDEHEATRGLPEETLLPEGVGLAVRYVPNMRPARRFRHIPAAAQLGQADFAGAEGLLDALDEVYTSWIRDVRLAKARIIVPRDYLERGEDGNWRFDMDREIWAGLDMDPSAEGQTAPTPVQFEIRTQEHEAAALHLIERIVDHAGYSPQTFGLRIEGRAESGTALRIRERRTFVTQARKQRYWQAPLAGILHVMLVLAREVYGNREIDANLQPHVQFEDSIAPSTLELAQTAEVLMRAKAASTETLVRLVHPDWSDEQVQAEVQRIYAEQGLGMPDLSSITNGIEAGGAGLA